MQPNNHISDHDLERYYLGMVKEEDELALPEEYLLACPACVTAAEESQDYVDALRAALAKTAQSQHLCLTPSTRVAERTVQYPDQRSVANVFLVAGKRGGRRGNRRL